MNPVTPAAGAGATHDDFRVGAWSSEDPLASNVHGSSRGDIY